jgi:hypothetical protein
VLPLKPKSAKPKSSVTIKIKLGLLEMAFSFFGELAKILAFTEKTMEKWIKKITRFFHWFRI